MLKFRSHFKLKRIRHQVFLIFALLLLLLFACLWVFSYQFYYKNYHQNQLSISQLALENSYKNFSHSLSMEKLRLDAFFSSDEIQQLIGMGDSCTSEDFITAATELSHILKISGYFEEACLRIRGTEMVIEADDNSNSWRTDSTDWDWSSYPKEGFSLDENGRSYLRYDFPISYPLASLQLYPDPQEMYQDIFSDHSLSPQTFLYTQDGTPLLSSLLNYPQTDNFYLTKVKPSSDSQIYRWNQDESLYVIATDTGEDGWLLVSLVSVDELMPPFLKGLQTLYPYFLCLTGIVLIGFILILRQICMPISSIAHSVYHSRQPNDCAEKNRLPDNEISVIGKGLQIMEDQQRKYSDLLEQITPQAENQLLRTLILDINADTSLIQDSLALIKSPFADPGRYAVVLLQWQLPENGSAAILAEGSARMELCNFSRTYWKAIPLCLLETGNCELTLALCLPHNCSGGEFQRTSKAFLLQLNLFSASKVYQVYGAAGPLCQDQRALTDAYRQAKGTVEQAKYYHGNPQDTTEESGSAVFYYRGKAEELLDTLASGEENAESQLLGLLREIPNSSDHTDCSQLYRAVTDPLAERMLHLQAKGDEAFFQLKARLDCSHIPSELDALLKPLAQEAQSLLQTLSQKEQYRHVQSAKRYMEQEYQDSALSLERVSSYLGISASYLSTLFRRYSTEGFIDYLNHYRVEQAKRLLVQSTYTASEIGFKTGFSSSQNFNRVFKKYCGITPGQYRTQAKAKPAGGKES